MASDLQKYSIHENERVGAEECYLRITKLLQDSGFPKGLLPLKDLEEFGYVRKTGFAWMKQKAPYDKQLLFGVSAVEMSIEDRDKKKIYFKSSTGIGKSYPITVFMTDEEKEKASI
ncbi:unnamed protein product [Withania somnifera]